MKHLRFMLIPGLLFPVMFLVNTAWVISGPAPGTEVFSESAVNSDSMNRTPAIDPLAVEVFQRAMNYLSTLKQFSVRGQSTYEDLLDSGRRVDYEMSGSVTVRRPDKFRSENHGSQFNQLYFYDGRSITQYNPSQKVYATIQATGTIDEMFQFAYDSLGISSPFSDLLHTNAFSLLTKSVYFASVIGKESIGDVQCDHLLFSRPDFDFQIWIADSGEPLTFKWVVTDKSIPGLLSFSVVLRNWDLNPDVSDDTFNFTAPQGTGRINFIKTGESNELNR